ncbi:uncharacterized protein LOC127837444 [Dreissena polymorpha]|uniref:Uncharacterized protein n=1 Tax=Dreissena polymorpha TaxID=45954 RepID=A0A9D4F6F1_DREPO|nr:uncharacterized protein LOC127837444 [Dreissena polymorpha]KAH3792151.1 hypothetical protein DPMN_145642 [Dreissena polymorpha]
MEHSALIILVIIATIYVTSCYALYIPSDEALEADPKYRELVDMDNEDSANLRKLLLKKLRFREILKEQMKSPEELLESQDLEKAEHAARHHASKRQKMEDLMTRVQAYLNQYKERQIKESMSLPSLRFGRSGIQLGQYQK